MEKKLKVPFEEPGSDERDTPGRYMELIRVGRGQAQVLRR